MLPWLGFEICSEVYVHVRYAWQAIHFLSLLKIVRAGMGSNSRSDLYLKSPNPILFINIERDYMCELGGVFCWAKTLQQIT